MSIGEFLLARIAEDEIDALNATEGPFTLERMLAECAAKRALLELHAGGSYRGQLTCASCGDWYDGSPEDYPCDNLKILGAVYADHPDYDPDWA